MDQKMKELYRDLVIDSLCLSIATPDKDIVDYYLAVATVLSQDMTDEEIKEIHNEASSRLMEIGSFQHQDATKH